MHVSGIKGRDIAKTLDISPHTVKAVLRSPIAQVEINRMLEDRNTRTFEDDLDAIEGRARSILQQSAESAAETQVKLLDSDDDSIKLRASGSILDRVLGKADAGQAEGLAPTIHIHTEQANLLMTAIKESQNGNGQDAIANFPSTNPSKDEQGDVHEARSERPRERYRASEAQSPREEVSVAQVRALRLSPTVSPEAEGLDSDQKEN